MDKNQLQDRIIEMREQLTDTTTSYWFQFSSLTTWQFWVVAALLVLPLVWLAYAVDRRRILELFFFGYSVHTFWAYTDIALERSAFFLHNYYLIPFLPLGINLSASLIPVIFILLYQYCLHRRKNFFLYAFALSAVLAFGFAPLEQAAGFLEVRNGLNFIHIFLINVACIYLSYGLTKLVLAYQRTWKRTDGEGDALVDRIGFKDRFSRRARARN